MLSSMADIIGLSVLYNYNSDVVESNAFACVTNSAGRVKWNTKWRRQSRLLRPMLYLTETKTEV